MVSSANPSGRIKTSLIRIVCMVFWVVSFKIPVLLNTLADLYALSRYFDASSKTSRVGSQAVSSSESDQVEDQKEGKKREESELRLAQLQHQLPSNEPGALMHLVEDAAGEDDDDEETKECKNLFKNMKFFLSREVRFIV